MELRHIRYLLAVAEHGNFTRAAESLHISQPTLSQQIKQLERRLEATLLDRSGRAVTLTDAGEAYVYHARLALRDLEAGRRAVHDVHDLSRGHLRIAMTPTFSAYLVGPLVHRFRAAHPNITLSIREAAQARIESDLAMDRLDIGIGFEGDHTAGIEALPLFIEPLSVVTATGHPLASSSRPVPLQRFAAEPLCLLNTDFATRLQLDHYFAQQGVTPSIAVEASSISAIVELVRNGGLATVLPDAVSRAHTDLRPIATEPAMPTRRVVLLRRSTDYRSRAARAFTEVVTTMTAPTIGSADPRD
ncbi:transcriptional regulator CynR [Tsukamurella sp. 1534]|uniref:transcriptional regulator CynR n=1 Tax=Tsukamurella sp. 1534 TaxID=1151061 RepID=UPI000307363F|nr:transcriptional regulator CynR [Tsukamurella sp. 1534]